MPLLYALLFGSLVFIAFAEGILWMMFRQRVLPLNFPKELDRTGMRMYGSKRVQVIALIHTLAMMALATFVLLFLW